MENLTKKGAVFSLTASFFHQAKLREPTAKVAHHELELPTSAGGSADIPRRSDRQPRKPKRPNGPSSTFAHLACATPSFLRGETNMVSIANCAPWNKGKPSTIIFNAALINSGSNDDLASRTSVETLPNAKPRRAKTPTFAQHGCAQEVEENGHTGRFAERGVQRKPVEHQELLNVEQRMEIGQHMKGKPAMGLPPVVVWGPRRNPPSSRQVRVATHVWTVMADFGQSRPIHSWPILWPMWCRLVGFFELLFFVFSFGRKRKSPRFQTAEAQQPRALRNPIQHLVCGDGTQLCFH